MKRRHQSLVAAVERAINEADPIGLLEGGAPSAEYSPEIGTIVPRVVNARSVDEVTAVLHEEFLRWFGEEPPAFARRTKRRRVEFGMPYWNIDGLDDSV